jgi:hypothetical protein
MNDAGTVPAQQSPAPPARAPLTKPEGARVLPGESSPPPEALTQVIECHQHSPGDFEKLLPSTLQRNHPSSLPAPESEDFPWLLIRLLAYHDELLSMIVFHDEPLHIHATSSPFPRIRSSAALRLTRRSLGRDRFFAHPCLLILIVTLIRHGEPLRTSSYTITCTGAAASTPQTSSMNLNSSVMAMEALPSMEMLCVDSIGYVPVLFSFRYVVSLPRITTTPGGDNGKSPPDSPVQAAASRGDGLDRAIQSGRGLGLMTANTMP